MKLSEYAELDATELAALVRGGAVSPRELVETALTAIQRTDKEIHAVVDYTYDYAMEQIKKGESIAVFIGPEGGFAPEEIEMVRDEMQLISLGRRILRTETAGIAALAVLGYQLESQTDGRDE